MSVNVRGFHEKGFYTRVQRQVVENGHPVAEVSARLGVSAHSLYQWIKQFGSARGGQISQLSSRDDEIRKLKAEVRRLTEERDILKNAAAYFARTSD
jgi:transposase